MSGKANLTFFSEGRLTLPEYAASGSIYELVVDRESFPALLGLFRVAERFELAVPGREGTLTAVFDLQGAASAAEDTRTRCEARFLDDSAFVFRGSSQRPLQAWEVAMLSPHLLRIARYESYARRGHRFSDPLLRAYFERKPWYTPRGCSG